MLLLPLSLPQTNIRTPFVSLYTISLSPSPFSLASISMGVGARLGVMTSKGGWGRALGVADDIETVCNGNCMKIEQVLMEL
jgi:hypothetical protein